MTTKGYDALTEVVAWIDSVLTIPRYGGEFDWLTNRSAGDGKRTAIDRSIDRMRALRSNPWNWILPGCTEETHALVQRTAQNLLLAAVEEGNVEMFERILSRLPEVGLERTKIVAEFRAPSAEEREYTVARCNLDGCKTEATTRHYEFTLAQHAAQYPSLAMLKAVVAAGADATEGRIVVQEKALHYYTPLYLAMKAGHLENALWLISLDYPEQFRKPEVSNSASDLPVDTGAERLADGDVLLVAYRTRSEALVRAMLARNADLVREQDQNPWWPRDHRCLGESRSVLADALDYEHDRAVPDFLLEGMRRGMFDLNIRGSSSSSSSGSGRREPCVLCPEVYCNDSTSPFVLAARAGNTQLFDGLLECASSSSSSETGFSRYLDHGRPTASVLRELLGDATLEESFATWFARRMRSEDVYAELSNTGETVLHLAARDDRHEPTLEALLERVDKGPDVAADHGATPLYEAVAHDCPRNAALLVRHDATSHLLAHRFPIWRYASKEWWNRLHESLGGRA